MNSTTVTNLILLYFAINFFLAGYRYSTDISWARDKTEITLAILTAIFLCTLGLVFYVLYFLGAVLLVIWGEIDSFTQLQFWFVFLFTKQFDSVEEDILQKMSKLSASKGNGQKDQIFKYCIKKVNERNNFIYKPETETTF